MNLEDVKKLSKEEIDKLYHSMTPEEKEEQKQKIELLSKALPCTLMVNPDLANIAYFGDVCSRYCEKFNCSPEQFCNELHILKDAFIENSINKLGVSFGERHKVPKHLQIQNKKNHDAMNKIMEKPKGYTLGDALKSSGVLDKLKGEMK